MVASVLGIVGGSGVYDIEMDNARWETIASPWGEPSDQVRRGEIGGLPVVFLPRHGEAMCIRRPPSTTAPISTC